MNNRRDIKARNHRVNVTWMKNPCAINLAAFCSSTRALGPGVRAALWLQGCPFQCPGCISPEWARQDIFNPVNYDKIAEQILQVSGLRGITLSGGEPMLQAENLTKLINHIRREREIDVICYTGYKLEDLKRDAGLQGIDNFLDEIDVLIDGPYISALNDNCGLRGSSNQRVHYFTRRLAEFDFLSERRTMEIYVAGDEITFVGIPDIGQTRAVESAFCSIGFLLLEEKGL